VPGDHQRRVTHRSRRGAGVVPALTIIAGVALVGLGVALNEAGIDAGRVILVLGFPVATIGLFLAWRSSDPPYVPAGRSGPSVEDVAARLGVARADEGFRGTFRGRSVQLYGEESGYLFGGKLVRPLDAGLTVTRGKPPGDARRESKTRDAEFDAIYAVRVDEPDRANALLSERLRRLLLEGDYRVDDDTVWRRIPAGPPEEVEQSAVRALKVAAEVERVAGPVPCAEPLRHAREAFATYAAERQLALAETPLSIWGRQGDVALDVRAVRDAFQQYHYEVDIKFDKPLGRGLVMNPASSSMQHDRSAEPVGHPKFDKYYVLKADMTDDASRLVGGETRKIILALRDRGVQVRVRDDGVWAWVGFHREQTERVLDAVGDLVTIAQRIAANANRLPATG